MVELRLPGMASQMVPLLVLPTNETTAEAPQTLQQPDLQQEFNFDSAAENDETIEDVNEEAVGSSESFFVTTLDETSDSG